MGLRNNDAQPDVKAEVEIPEVNTEVSDEVGVEEKAVEVRQEAPPPSTKSISDLTLMDMENRWAPDDVGNVFPRIKASSGSINGDGVKYGEYIDMQVLTWHKRWFIVPGVNDEDAQKLCRASYDGKSIIDRETGDSIPIQDYLEDLRAQGYTKAKVSDYFDVIGIIFNSQKELEKARAKGVVQLSIAPTSKAGFTAFARQGNLLQAMGHVLPGHKTCVRVSAEEITSKKGEYTKTTFSPVPLDIQKGFTPVQE